MGFMKSYFVKTKPLTITVSNWRYTIYSTIDSDYLHFDGENNYIKDVFQRDWFLIKCADCYNSSACHAAVQGARPMEDRISKVCYNYQVRSINDETEQLT